MLEKISECGGTALRSKTAGIKRATSLRSLVPEARRKSTHGWSTSFFNELLAEQLIVRNTLAVTAGITKDVIH